MKLVGADNAGFIKAENITDARTAYDTLMNGVVNKGAKELEHINRNPGIALATAAEANGGAGEFNKMDPDLFVNTTAPKEADEITADELGKLIIPPGNELANAAITGTLKQVGAADDNKITAAEIRTLRANFKTVRNNPTDAQNGAATAAGGADFSTVDNVTTNPAPADITKLTLAELTRLGLWKTDRLTAKQKTAVIDDSTNPGGAANTDGNLTTLGAAAASFITRKQIIKQRIAQPTAAQAAAANAGDLTPVGSTAQNHITWQEIVAADTKANNIKAVVDGPRINQKPKGGNQGTYLYYKSIFPSMSLNSVTRQ